MVMVFFENAAYVTSLGRFVASRYADGLFPRVYRAEDGTAYNVSGNPLRDRPCDHCRGLERPMQRGSLRPVMPELEELSLRDKGMGKERSL